MASPTPGAPRLIGTPPPPLAAFQPREAIHAEVSAALREPCEVVLQGMPGTGKTAFAAALARARVAAQEVDLVVWVDASSRDRALASYAAAATQVTGQIQPDLELAAETLLNWLYCSDLRWMVVLDGVQRSGDLRGLRPHPYRCGRALITVRGRHASMVLGATTVIEMDSFQLAEARACLTALLPPHLAEEAGLEKLAAALGCLPAAVVQAAAFLRRHDLAPQDYLTRLADPATPLTALMPAAAELPDAYPLTTVETVTHAVRTAAMIKPGGLIEPLLRIASLLEPLGAPAAVFTTPAIGEYLARQTGTAPRERDISASLAALIDRSGLGVWRDSTIWVDVPALHAVEINPLAQLVAYRQMTAHQVHDAVTALLSALTQLADATLAQTTTQAFPSRDHLAAGLVSNNVAALQGSNIRRRAR